jgi:hypothetical protein
MAVRNGTVKNHSYFQRVVFSMEGFAFPERSFYDVQLLICWAKIRHASDLRRSLARVISTAPEPPRVPDSAGAVDVPAGRSVSPGIAWI